MLFPSYFQLDSMDCGPTCLRIIAAFYGRHYSLQNLRDRCHITREGVSLLAYIIHSGFISGYQNRYGDNLKPPTNVYHRMTA